MSTPQRVYSLVGLLSLTVAAAWLYAHEGHRALPSRGAKVDAALGRIVLTRESREALDVRSIEIAPTALPETILAGATVTAPWQRHAFISTALPGRITKLHVHPGQQVAVGTIMTEVASLELESLRIDALAAQTEGRLSEQLIATLKQSAGSVPGQDLFDAEAKHRQFTMALSLARARWGSLGLDDNVLDRLLADPSLPVPDLPIRSVIAGTVVHADLSAGRVVEPGEHLFEVINLERVLVNIGTLEKDLPRIAVGHEVAIRLTALPNTIFRSHIKAIDLAIDQQTHLNAVWAELENPTGQEPRLLPGMTGQARIHLPIPAAARSVPAAAVINDGLSQYVLVEEVSAAKQSEYQRRNVSIIRQTPAAVEIRSSQLLPKDRVVTQGAHELGSFFVPDMFRLSPESLQTAGVVTAAVGRQPIEDVIQLDGSVELSPQAQGSASARLAGNIARIHVDRGQTVRRGQLLAEVASPELYKMQVDYLREGQELALAEQQLQSARRTGELLARRKLLESEALVAAARNRSTSLRRRLEAVGIGGEQIEELVTQQRLIETIAVRSPIDGAVASFDRIIGQAVKAEEPLFTIHDLSKPLIEAIVPERDFARVRIGQTARIRLIAAAQPWTGRVVRTSRTFMGGGQSLTAWIEPDGPPQVEGRHGLLARVTLIVSNGPTMLVVPRSALWREGMREFVFVLKPDGVFERRPVTTDRNDDHAVAIAAGLTEGETIAIHGVAALQTAYGAIR